MKETFYFSHDYNARSDERIIKLISKCGWEGYGLYWAIIEKLYEAGGFLKTDYDCLAFDMRTDSERIKNVIECGLFNFSNNKFYSKSVLARLRVRKGKSEQARQSAFLRWDKPKKEDAKAMRTHSDSNAIKESKIKDNKVYKDGIPPSLEEVKKYCEERKNKIDPNGFINFYESKGWLIGKNKMKDWRAAIRTWEQREAKSAPNNVKILHDGTRAILKFGQWVDEKDSNVKIDPHYYPEITKN